MMGHVSMRALVFALLLAAESYAGARVRLQAGARVRLKVVETVTGLGLRPGPVVAARDMVLFGQPVEDTCGGVVLGVLPADPTRPPVVLPDPYDLAGCTEWGDVFAGSADRIIVGDWLGRQAFVYSRAGELERILPSPSPVEDTFAFGIGVAIAGDTALVESSVGIYVFNLASPGPGFDRALIQRPPAASEFFGGFGEGLAITNERVIVGDEVGQIVYAYDRETLELVWGSGTPFSGNSAHAFFGASIAADEESVFVSGGIDNTRGHGREVLAEFDTASGRLVRALPLPRRDGIGVSTSIHVSRHWIVANKLIKEPAVRLRTYVLNRKTGKVVATFWNPDDDSGQLAQVRLVNDRLVMPYSDGYQVLRVVRSGEAEHN